ncbi:hypothetical protein EJ02DRAFT_206185 [Clathrospora elynae]|uniref:Rhodopsin domain-containing protein n=1 Tax=Clathrospora elynae TaxID=706981 RepID=A0A6A5SNV3_9PLEO|nr:hypothetical protein EJ02DRAFT_206185 [Clathrospora elynae]
MTAVSFDNPRGRQAVEISTIFTILAAIVVALRLYARFFVVRCAGIEDLGIILAMLCSVGLTICIGIQANYGMGEHLYELSEVDMIKTLQAFWASLIVYYLSLGLTKGSVLLQYRRVFTTKRFQIMCWIIMAVVIAYTVWTVLGSIFACVPVRAFWTKEKASCLNQYAMWFTNASINIATDFAIIILPIPVIRNLSLGKRQKIGLIAIFAVGGLVCIVSILRLQSLIAISNSLDPTYDNPPAATMSSVEINVGIICSCLPLLRPLFSRWLPSVVSSRGRTIPTRTRTQTLATFGSRSDGSGLRSKNEYALDVSKRSKSSSDDLDTKDIQVITDIHVSVETGKLSGWRTPAQRDSSTEILFEDQGMPRNNAGF